MLLFLAINGIELSYTQRGLSDIITDTASGKAGYEEILAWITEHEI